MYLFAIKRTVAPDTLFPQKWFTSRSRVMIPSYTKRACERNQSYYGRVYTSNVYLHVAAISEYDPAKLRDKESNETVMTSRERNQPV